MVIAIDFDGTLCKHEYPKIGDELPGAIETCLKLQEEGHKLILWTMRGNKFGATTLDEAVAWCKDRGLEFWGVNENPEQIQSGWSNSNKQYAQLYIDDAALGCPLNTDEYSDQPVVEGERPWVDWSAVKYQLEEKRILTPPIKLKKAGKKK